MNVGKVTMDGTTTFTNPFTGQSRQIPEGVTVRKGVPEDETKILELCQDVQHFNDWDFLPGLWTMITKNPNYLLIVAEKDGKVLAVSGMLVLNKGQSWLECANRSSPTIRGNNVFWACNARRIAEGLNNYGIPSNMSAVCTDLHSANKARTYGENYKAVMFSHFYHVGHHMNAESVQTLSDHVMNSVTSSAAVHAMPSATEFAELLSDPDKQFALFPEGYFKTVYTVYEAIPQSAYDVWENSPLKWAALSKNDDRLTFSFVSTNPVRGGKGVNFQFEMFGHVDCDVFMSHLRHHLPQMLSMYADYEEMFLVLEIPNRYCLEPFKDIFRKKLKLQNYGIESSHAVSMYCKPPKICT